MKKFIKKLKLRIKGFTLVEMLISMGIVTLIMGAVLYNYSGFSDNLALSGAAQEVAVAIRQAQSYGASVKTTSGSTYAYGAHFDTIDSKNYVIFADKDGDRVYDVGNGCGSANTECVEKIPLRDNVSVSGVCNGTSCAPAAGVKGVDVTFHRPSTDAKIVFTDGAGTAKTGLDSVGKVILSSAKSITLSVSVENTGQINIGAAPSSVPSQYCAISAPLSGISGGQLLANPSTKRGLPAKNLTMKVTNYLPDSRVTNITLNGSYNGGSTWFSRGVMHDDGANGDDVAGDKCFTLTYITSYWRQEYVKSTTDYSGQPSQDSPVLYIDAIGGD